MQTYLDCADTVEERCDGIEEMIQLTLQTAIAMLPLCPDLTYKEKRLQNIVDPGKHNFENLCFLIPNEHF